MSDLTGHDLKEAARIIERGMQELGASLERATENYVNMQNNRSEGWREVASNLVSELQAILWKR